MKNCFYLICLVLLIVAPMVYSNNNEKPSKSYHISLKTKNTKNSYSHLNLLSKIYWNNSPKTLKLNNTNKQISNLVKFPKRNSRSTKASDVKKPANEASTAKSVHRKTKVEPHKVKPFMAKKEPQEPTSPRNMQNQVSHQPEEE